MNSKALFAVAAFAALAATAARADDITIDNTPFHSSRTRAEVQAELSQFKQSGVNPWSTSYNQLARLDLSNSRAQVRSEYIAHRDQVAAFTGEDSGSAYLSSTAAATTRVPDSATLAGAPVNGQ
jgi:hypothetical protein